MENIYAKNALNYNITRNMSFLKFFPQTANIESINVMDLSNNILPSSVVGNYYMTVMSANANENIFNETVILNDIPAKVSSDSSINTSGFILFVNNKKAKIDLESVEYNEGTYDANISIKAIIPYAEQNSVITLVLFYPFGSTNFLQEYSSLNGGSSMDFVSLKPEKSNVAEVIFTASLDANENKKFVLYYEINTNTKISYIPLSVDNSGIEIIYDDNYYFSQGNINSYESSDSYSIKKSVLTSSKNCLINMKVWNYE
jgi:hypothetical protein